MTTIDLPPSIHGVYYPATRVGTHDAQPDAVVIMYGDHEIARVTPRFNGSGVDRLHLSDITNGYAYSEAEENEIAEYTVAKVFAHLLSEYNIHG